MTYSTKTTRLLTAFVALLVAAPALAALQDHGPADPVLVFPQWYRDSNQTAIGLCKSQVPSPNAAAGLKPMCFPLANDPAGFAGNLGNELFYSDLNVAVTNGAFDLRYTAALEATYLPGPTPVHGQEVLFARIRVVANIQTPGTYTVTHPYGVEVFPNVTATGARAIFFTADVPLGTPLDFEGALGGRVGPFIQWDVLNPGESLTNSAGEQFLGDANFPHTFTGSPFGTNYVRVDGPPGSNLDGAGNTFIIQPLGSVLGQKWTAAIPTAFNIKKSVYSRGAVLNTVDVWATSAAGQNLVLTSAGMPSLKLVEFPAGQYYGHLEYPIAALPPATVTVTNLTSVPVVSATAQLVDQLDAVTTFDPATRVVSITASSSDTSGPTLTVVAPFGGLMTPGAAAGTYTFASLPLAANVEPPISVRVESNAGGVYLSTTVVGSGNPMNAAGLPIAVDDLNVLVSGTVATTIPVFANDTFAGAATALVMTQPATGTAVATATGVIYTPKAGAQGLDSFTYAVQDAVGISNVATVTFTVPFVAPAPTANADNTATQTGTARVVNVLANDVAGAGTTIDPLSVQVVGAGASVNPATGAVTYTAGAATGVFTFTYTVANTLGTRSAPATVTMVVFGGPEALSFSRIQYTVSRSTWSVVGSTNWFAAQLTQNVATCWLGTAAAPTASTLIGTSPVDTAGKFAVAPVGPTPTPVAGNSVTCKDSFGGIRSGVVSIK